MCIQLLRGIRSSFDGHDVIIFRAGTRGEQENQTMSFIRLWNKKNDLPPLPSGAITVTQYAFPLNSFCQRCISYLQDFCFRILIFLYFFFVFFFYLLFEAPRNPCTWISRSFIVLRKHMYFDKTLMWHTILLTSSKYFGWKKKNRKR